MRLMVTSAALTSNVSLSIPICILRHSKRFVPPCLPAFHLLPDRRIRRVLPRLCSLALPFTQTELNWPTAILGPNLKNGTARRSTAAVHRAVVRPGASGVMAVIHWAIVKDPPTGSWIAKMLARTPRMLVAMAGAGLHVISFGHGTGKPRGAKDRAPTTCVITAGSGTWPIDRYL